MSVRPLAIKKKQQSEKNAVEGRDENELRHGSSTSLTATQLPDRPIRQRAQQLARPHHLEGGRQDRIFGVQFGHCPPAPARLLLVEGLPGTPFAKRDDLHRLEELVVILAHEALAAVEDFDLHALELEDLSCWARVDFALSMASMCI
jgi:hypothetical protein